MIKSYWITFKWFWFTAIHKWNSFIQLLVLDPSKTFVIWCSADCSFLGEISKYWQHFLQADKWYNPPPKSPWSTAGVVSILWKVHSNYTVYCHVGQSGTAGREIPGICIHELVTITIHCSNTAWRPSRTDIMNHCTNIAMEDCFIIYY